MAVGLMMVSASPAQASPWSPSNPYQFGYYYTLSACQYFGNSLVQGHAFSSYSCMLKYNEDDRAYYYYLYVW